MWTIRTNDPPRGRLLRTAAPAAEPVSVADAKKQLEVHASDTAHDSQLSDLIIAAREQFEHDTQYACVSQTFEYILDDFPHDDSSIVLPRQPVTSLTSIAYQDGSASKTLATSVADLDRQKRRIVLQYDQQWPSIERQNDAVVITFIAGYPSQSAVPRLVRQAVLLQVSKLFEDRDMMMQQSPDAFDLAYERIIARLKRSSYP